MGYLGIELGSTRIKAVEIDEKFVPVSSGDYTWHSEFVNGIWTYDIDEVWTGLKIALKSIGNPGNIKCIGLSGMMHGYLAFDKDWNLLTPFRTWQNTITGQAAAELSLLFGVNIPQRWSIAHLYQAILNDEEHIDKVAHITTLAGYVHHRLTGVNAVGIGEASGIFPIDTDKLDYNKTMLEKFQKIISEKNISWNIFDILPTVLVAGEGAGVLTKDGATLIDNILPEGIPFSPPEGDAGTGMVATNAIAPGTGNISAGTSIFSMVVLEKPLSDIYEEIDIVTTPSGNNVAMVHCNNCTNDSNEWISVLKEAVSLFGIAYENSDVYTKLYEKSLEGDPDCGGVLVCNYMAGEGITRLDSGRPFVIRNADSKFTLANFLRATLYSTMVTLKIGMQILENENVEIKNLMGHGGLFKTPIVGQKYMAAACKVPVTVMKTAGEGGPYGTALLAAFCAEGNMDETLEYFLSEKVFKEVETNTVEPGQDDIKGFEAYTNLFKKAIEIEKTAIENI